MLKVAVFCACLVHWAHSQFTTFNDPYAQQGYRADYPYRRPGVVQTVYPRPVDRASPQVVDLIQPYSFSYDAIGHDGSSSRSESGDGRGRVTGYYTLSTGEGSRRRVSYVADEGGFRATVDTNEHGTADDSPADVVFRSTAPKLPSGPAAQRVHTRTRFLPVRVGGPTFSVQRGDYEPVYVQQHFAGPYPSSQRRR
ncbi:uncharacterized protein LOC135399493 [Ornithodoros turicata]|uniref:uncharacterized protein LOC135399493 n=1 Tax=Ornithodoros turicata TaxID=34597 RepID=UPI003138F3D1